MKLGDHLSHYELLERLGTGGMGTVWLARDTRNGDDVAVKILHAHLAADAEYVRRFEREARIASSIDSPNVVKVLDSGSDGDSRFLVMEHVAGKTLARHIHEQGRLSIDETVSISMAIAAALEAAHALGIIHRDISPQNVLIEPDGTAKVTDFGVARDLGATAMTATSMLLGKPQYIAPEVVTGQSPADIRSDIYALGIVMYQMLTGAVPFNAETPYAVMQASVSQAPAPLAALRADAPAWLVEVCETSLAKRPSERYQTPEELLRAFNLPVAAVPLPGSQVESPDLPARSRSPLLLGGIATAVVAMVIAFAIINTGAANDPIPSAFEIVESLPALVSTQEAVPTAVATTEAGADSPLPRRYNCQEIRGTEYRSPAEQEWYKANCSPAATSVAGPVSLAFTGQITDPAIVNTFFSGRAKVYGLKLSGVVFPTLATAQDWQRFLTVEGANISYGRPAGSPEGMFYVAVKEEQQAQQVVVNVSLPNGTIATTSFQHTPTLLAPTAVSKSGVATLKRAGWYEPGSGPCDFSRPLNPNALPLGKSVCLAYDIETTHTGPFFFRIAFSYAGRSSETPGFTVNGPLKDAGAVFTFDVPGPIHFEFLVDGLTSGSTDAVVGQ